MKTRAITGILFVIILVGSLLFGPWAFSILFFLIAVLSLHEFYQIIKADPLGSKALNNNLNIEQYAATPVNANTWPGLSLGAALFACLISIHLADTNS